MNDENIFGFHIYTYTRITSIVCYYCRSLWN